MSSESDKAAERALLLELAQIGMDLARRVRDVAQSAAEPDQLAALVNAYHQAGRGVRQSLALRARFAAGTVAPERVDLGRAENTEAPAPARDAPKSDVARSDPHSSDAPSSETERGDWTERPDWTGPSDWRTPVAANERLETLDADDDVNRARIARNLTVVSRTPALAAIPALRAPAAALAGRAALLTGASIRLVNSS